MYIYIYLFVGLRSQWSSSRFDFLLKFVEAANTFQRFSSQDVHNTKRTWVQIYFKLSKVYIRYRIRCCKLRIVDWNLNKRNKVRRISKLVHLISISQSAISNPSLPWIQEWKSICGRMKSYVSWNVQRYPIRVHSVSQILMINNWLGKFLYDSISQVFPKRITASKHQVYSNITPIL